MAVPCRPNSLVMNIGDMLAAMSGVKFKATKHRVIDTRVDRFSVPFFFEPHYAADVTRVIPWQQKEALSPSKTSGNSAAELDRKFDRACLQEEDLTPSTTRSSSAELGRKFYGPWLIEKMRSFSEYREILDCLDHFAA